MKPRNKRDVQNKEGNQQVATTNTEASRGGQPNIERRTAKQYKKQCNEHNDIQRERKNKNE